MLSEMSAPFRGFRGTTSNSQFVFFMRGNSPFARSKVVPVNRRTDDQTKIRAYLSAASKNWANLTDAQRTAWNTWAETYLDNATSDPSANTRVGLDAYVKANSIRQILGLALTSDAPAIGLPTPVTGITQVLADSDDEYKFTLTHSIASGSVTDYKILVRITPPAGTAAQTPKLSETRFVKHVSPSSAAALAASGSGSEYTFSSGQFSCSNTKKYGMSVLIVHTATGLASSPFFTSFVHLAA